ncbi:MAG: hypothetical protein V8Q65_06120 [Bacteroidaceae bacterium]
MELLEKQSPQISYWTGKANVNPLFRVCVFVCGTDSRPVFFKHYIVYILYVLYGLKLVRLLAEELGYASAASVLHREKLGQSLKSMILKSPLSPQRNAAVYGNV